MEILTVILILGVLTAIALASLGSNLHSSAREAVHKRNAQELAALSLVAQANGADPVVEGDAAATVTNLIDGVSATSPDGKPLIYRSQFPRSGSTFDGALHYLSVAHGILTYNGNRPAPVE